MENLAIINLYFIIEIFLFVNITFLWLVKKYSWKSSWSAYAGPLTLDGRRWLFFLFIIHISALAVVAYTILSAVAGALLFMIGIITGYNPEIHHKRLEDTLHVIFVDGAMVIFAFIAIFNFDLFNFNLINTIIVGSGIFVIAILLAIDKWIIKIKGHTTIIEYLYFLLVVGCLLNSRVINLEAVL